MPSAVAFPTDLSVYDWMVKKLLPASSIKVLVGACKNWANYTCGSANRPFHCLYLWYRRLKHEAFLQSMGVPDEQVG